MTLEQLRTFVAVAECQHMTRASGRLNRTASTISAAISALESEHAVKLFDRVGRRIVLTDAGQVFLVEARAILMRVSAASDVLSDLAGLKRGRINLAASQTVAGYWLPEMMHRYRSSYPGIEISLSVGNTEIVAGWVRDGIAGLGFVEGETVDPLLVRSVVADDEMVLVVGRGHPWFPRKKIEPRELTTSKWIVREPGSGTRAIFEAVALRAKIPLSELDIAMELPSNEAVRTAVEAGAGAAIMSRLVAATAIKLKSLSVIPFQIPRRHFVTLRHRDRYFSRSEQALIDLIKSACTATDYAGGKKYG